MTSVLMRRPTLKEQRASQNCTTASLTYAKEILQSMVLSTIKSYNRKKRHIREVEKYLEMLMLDNVNLSLHASRFGWTDDLQNQLTNSALLIRKYQRRLRLIMM